MATNGTAKLVQYGGAAVLVLATAFTLFQVNGEVSTLQVKVRGLEASVEALDALETRIAKLQDDVGRIEGFRHDILVAICVANARTAGDLRRCHSAGQ